VNQVNWQRRRDILICVICLGIIIWTVWGLVNQFVEAIFLLLLGMAVAFLITPGVNFLQERGVPRLLATIIIYDVVLAALGGFFYALIFSLINQVEGFSLTIVDFIDRVPDRLKTFIDFLETQGKIPDGNIQTAIAQIQTQVTQFANSAASGALNIMVFVANTFIDFVVVLVISFYLTLDGKRIRDGLFSIIPSRWLPHAHLFEDSLNRVVGNYIRGQLILALIVGVMTAIVCFITDLGQFALVFGVLGFLFETIPMVGPLLASISPILVSMLLGHPWPLTIEVIVCFILIQAIESNVLGPRIVGHAVGLHPVASILALLVFAKLFGTAFGAFAGALGALVATPIVAAAWVVIASAYRSMRGEAPDGILLRKRAPWTLQRPTVFSSIRLRPTVNWGRGREGGLVPADKETEASSSAQSEAGSEVPPLGPDEPSGHFSAPVKERE